MTWLVLLWTENEMSVLLHFKGRTVRRKELRRGSGAGAFQIQWRHSLIPLKQEKQSDLMGAPRVTEVPRSSVTCIVTWYAWCQAGKSRQWVMVWFSSAKYRARHGEKSLNISAAPAGGDRILLSEHFHIALSTQLSFNTAHLHYCSWHWTNVGAQIPGAENSIGKVS